MENISLITSLYIGLAKNTAHLTLTNGMPSAQDLEDYFEKAPLVLERSDLREDLAESDQGDILTFSIRANIPRGSDYYLQFAGKEVIVYLRTANNENYFMGNEYTPMTFLYSRDSGAGNADNRETLITLSLQIPL